MTIQTGPGPRHDSFAHEAVLFGSDDELVDTAARHLLGGAEAGEHLVVACTTPANQGILAALADGPQVSVLAADTYGNPGAVAQRYRDLVRVVVESGANGLRVAGQLPAGTNAAPHTWPGWSRHEAVINHALAPLPFNALCAYDVRDTDPALLGAVRRTHRHLWQDGERHDNPDYLQPDACLRTWADPAVLPVESRPPLLVIQQIRDAWAARAARNRVGEVLAGLDTALVPYAGELPPVDPALVETEEYLLGVDEVLTNAISHGTGPVTLRLWVDHDQVVTTITDAGPGFDDPFIGYTMQSDRPGSGRPGP
ncbi:MAG TPA: sensor histidine kinase, partial [Marmoricola sp.]|nr:sensor histidine kinase [Marmoricola sp.]